MKISNQKRPLGRRERSTQGSDRTRPTGRRGTPVALLLGAIGALGSALPTLALASGIHEQPGALLGAAIDDALTETSLGVVWQVGTPFPGVDAAWQAPNRAQELRAFFLPDGVRVVPRLRTDQDWMLGLAFAELARGSRSRDAGPARIEVSGPRAEYRRDDLVEWYVNREAGLEQGFHLPARPLAEAGEGEPLELRFALEGDLRPGEITPAYVRFDGPGGEALLALHELLAFDANGEDVPCTFADRSGQLVIVLEDRDATYPVTIDPLIVSESARLDATLPPEADRFGASIDVEGSLAIVGAPSPSGVAYIFRETDGIWELDAKLVPDTNQAGSSFGSDVAIRGDLAAVGARNDSELETGSGAAYTYEYDGTNWVAEDKWHQTVPEFNGQFGTALDILPGWLFVGAPREDGPANGSGAVYMYKRSTGSWFYFDVLRPDGAPNARAGSSLDADGLRLAVGAPGQSSSSPVGGEVHVFRKAVVDDTWTLEDTLSASFTPDLGASVAIEGDTIAAGSPHTGNDRGAVLFFRRQVDNSWTHFDSLFGSQDGARFGWSVAMDDSTGALRAIAGAPFDTGFFENSGSATVIKYETLTHDMVVERELRAQSQFTGSQFGVAVALSGTQAFVGTELDTIGIPYRSGTVQVFDRDGGSWNAGGRWMGTAQDAYDFLGSAVAIEGDLAVVGSPGDDDNGPDAGAAYIFERIDGAWTQTARLAGFLFTQARSQLGRTAATDGHRIVVAAPHEDVDGTVGVGAAYVFEERVPDGWSMVARLLPSDPSATVQYGHSLDVEGDLIAVGSTTNTAYVYRRGPDGAWNEVQRLAGETGSSFGHSVAIDAGEVLIGSPNRVPLATVQRYTESQDDWSLAQTLSSDDGGFGYSLATSAGQLAVGAPYEPNPSVHLFERAPEGFVARATLESDALYFGHHVGVGGETTVVAARQRAFAYQRTGTLLVESELVASDGPFSSESPPVAVSNGSVLLGYRRGSAIAHAAGAAYIYELAPPSPIQPFGFGDGSTVPCPCGNDSTPGAEEGCANSTGVGARLFATGSSSLSADDMLFAAEQIPPGKSTQLFIGQNRLAGLPFGDGLRIATVPFIRIHLQQSSASGTVTWGGLHATGFWGPGDVRFFQAFYRDPGGPCGSGFNVTNAVQVVFEP